MSRARGPHFTAGLDLPQWTERMRGEFAERIERRAPRPVPVTQASSRRFLEEEVRACVAAFGPDRAERAGTEDAQEGVASFVERRDPVFQGR